MIRLFDNLGEGYITVERFREILREIDNTISEEELDGIINEVRPIQLSLWSKIPLKWLGHGGSIAYTAPYNTIQYLYS